MRILKKIKKMGVNGTFFIPKWPPKSKNCVKKLKFQQSDFQIAPKFEKTFESYFFPESSFN